MTAGQPSIHSNATRKSEAPAQGSAAPPQSAGNAWYGSGSSKRLNTVSSQRFQVQSQDVKYVLDRLTPDEVAHSSNADVSIFIRATCGNLDQAVKRLKDTLKWRASEKPETMTCVACQGAEKAHYLHLVGFDPLKRPIMYSCISMASNKQVIANRNHMIATFEQALKVMPPGVESWVWVCDFHGFGLSDCDPRLSRAFVTISAAHYPERLGLFLLVGAPRMFSSLWKLVSPMVDPVTKRKIRFVSYDYQSRGSKGLLWTELQKHFHDDMVQWLCTEMAENRNSRIAKHKVYSYAGLINGKARQSNSTHNCHGMQNMVDVFANRTDLVLPFAIKQ